MLYDWYQKGYISKDAGTNTESWRTVCKAGNVFSLFYAYHPEWGQVHFIGYSLFETDKRGVYKENLLAADRVIEARISTYVSAEILHQVGRALQVELAEVIKGSYEGYLGVDMMICRTQNSGYAIHPCVEINLRMNMGQRRKKEKSEGVLCRKKIRRRQL